MKHKRWFNFCLLIHLSLVKLKSSFVCYNVNVGLGVSTLYVKAFWKSDLSGKISYNEKVEVWDAWP